MAYLIISTGGIILHRTRATRRSAEFSRNNPGTQGAGFSSAPPRYGNFRIPVDCGAPVKFSVIPEISPITPVDV
ncbi:MAG TPA: hypothetical protein VLT36_16450 [Candidatus Dormibacteraeota bacterium]|nr:hypothetical protein [Candidatus Dormibacteraeota bacterium]